MSNNYYAQAVVELTQDNEVYVWGVGDTIEEAWEEAIDQGCEMLISELSVVHELPCRVEAVVAYLNKKNFGDDPEFCISYDDGADIVDIK